MDREDTSFLRIVSGIFTGTPSSISVTINGNPVTITSGLSDNIVTNLTLADLPPSKKITLVVQLTTDDTYEYPPGVFNENIVNYNYTSEGCVSAPPPTNLVVSAGRRSYTNFGVPDDGYLWEGPCTATWEKDSSVNLCTVIGNNSVESDEFITASEFASFSTLHESSKGRTLQIVITSLNESGKSGNSVGKQVSILPTKKAFEPYPEDDATNVPTSPGSIIPLVWYNYWPVLQIPIVNFYKLYIGSEFSTLKFKDYIVDSLGEGTYDLSSNGLVIFGNAWRVDTCIYLEDLSLYIITGDVWTFDISLTISILPPDNISPPDESTDLSSSSIQFEWSDPNIQGPGVLGPVITYDLLINDVVVASNIAYQGESAVHTVSGFKYNTHYTWQVKIKTGMGDIPGPVWSFTTKTVGAGAGGGPPLPTGRNAGTRVQHLIAAADDSVWYET
jgi:hypothetical protein